MGKHVHRTTAPDLDTGTIECNNCGTVQTKWVWREGKYTARCSVGHAEHKKRWHQNNRDYRSPNIKENQKKRKLAHGLTQQEVVEFKKGKKCEICWSPTGLVVDHDHDTGIIRGVLCGQCNSGIGMFWDDIDLLNFASDYLRKHGKIGVFSDKQLEESCQTQ